MNSACTDAYLRRIAAARPPAPTAEALRELHLAHLRSVPFENLSIHLGEEIVLTEDALVAKVVNARRGGFCYELNGAFGALLTSLGYEVGLLQGRVHGAAGLGIPYDHLALLVRTDDGGQWLADVGFGTHSHYPLDLTVPGTEQTDPGGVFVVTGTADGDLDVLKDGKPEYRLERRPRHLADFRAAAWYHRSCPASGFTRSLVCSRLTADGRITLSGSTLKRTVGEQQETSELSTDTEVLDAYRAHFGIELDRIPRVMAPVQVLTGN